MVTTTDVKLHHILIALTIALGTLLAALFFYFVLRRVAHKLAEKTTTTLDNILIESLEWPVFAAITITGLYFTFVYLPFELSIDHEVKRVFYIGFYTLAAYSVWSLLDGIFRWFKQEVTSKSKTVLDDWIVAILRIVTPVIAVLLVLLGSLEQYHVNTSSVREWLVDHGSRIGLITVLSTIVIFGIGVAVPAAIKAFVAKGMEGQSEEEVQKRAHTLTNVLVTTGQIFIILITTFVILAELGINIAPIMAGFGVVGIAIGFGAQSLVKDILAGFFVVMENQYRVGDFVKIADVSGEVKDINLRRTVIRDMDGVVHIVPNGEIRVASNLTKEWARVNLNVSVSYGTDLDKAIEVINRVCQEMAEEPRWKSMILKIPQAVRVDKLGDSGIDIKILGDTKAGVQVDVTSEIRKRLKKAFDDEGIEMPYPHMMVYFGNSPSAPSTRGNGGQSIEESGEI